LCQSALELFTGTTRDKCGARIRRGRIVDGKYMEMMTGEGYEAMCRHEGEQADSAKITANLFFKVAKK
jgi:hypothetical protein